MPPRRLKIALALLVVYLVWGSTYFVLKFAVVSLPPFLLVGIRNVQKRLEEESNKKLAETNAALAKENEALKTRVAELEAELEAELTEVKELAEEKEKAKATATAASKPAVKTAAKPAATVAAAEKKKAVQNLRDKLTGGSGGK